VKIPAAADFYRRKYEYLSNGAGSKLETDRKRRKGRGNQSGDDGDLHEGAHPCPVGSVRGAGRALRWKPQRLPQLPCGRTECPARHQFAWRQQVEIQFSRPTRYPANGLYFNKSRWVAVCTDGHNIALCEQVHWGKSPNEVMAGAFASGVMKIDPNVFADGRCTASSR
jgi:hypothetical protein